MYLLKVEILEEDLNELESMQIIPQSGKSRGQSTELKVDPLIGKKAPLFESVLLDESILNFLI